MASIKPLEAYSRALLRGGNEFERLQQIREKTPPFQSIKKVAEGGSSHLHEALSVQLATASRYIDLARIKEHHVETTPEGLLLNFVGGKTDRSSTGQPIILPPTCRASKILLRRKAATAPQLFLFPTITYNTYHAFLKMHLNVSTHAIRHAALTHVALQVSEEAAQALGRHRTVSPTRGYTPRVTWASALKSVEATRSLL